MSAALTLAQIVFWIVVGGLIVPLVAVAFRALSMVDGKALFASRESPPGGQRAARTKHRAF